MDRAHKKSGWVYQGALSSVSLLAIVLCVAWLASLFSTFGISWKATTYRDWNVECVYGYLCVGSYNAYKVPHSRRPRTNSRWTGLASFNEIGWFAPKIGYSSNYWRVAIPGWQLFILLAIWPAVALRKYCISHPPQGMCPACGYDLRGSPSGVCPECGAEASSSDTTAKAK